MLTSTVPSNFCVGLCTYVCIYLRVLRPKMSLDGPPALLVRDLLVLPLALPQSETLTSKANVKSNHFPSWYHQRATANANPIMYPDARSMRKKTKRDDPLFANKP